jgi:uncharacterized protein
MSLIAIKQPGVVLEGPDSENLVAFHTYLWKIASRCNLNCSYCYVYNRGDSQWERQPRFMSESVARQTATRIRRHCETRGKRDLSIIFHGGEPLLGGVEHIDLLTKIIAQEFDGFDGKISVGMQSNALLFSEEIADLFLRRRMTVGVSLDGPPSVNDRHRVDHLGRPSSEGLERALRLITSEKYRSILGGLLCVIDLDADPVVVTEYLLSWKPPSIDLLFPLDNHDRLPKGKTENLSSNPYGQWLVKAFDHWLESGSKSRIRIFNSIIALLGGGRSLVESLGLAPVDLIVIETNGEIEAVDSLKTTFNGGSALGMNVFDHSFDEVARHFAVRSRQRGVAALCDTCRNCPIVKVCGSGYVANRYSRERKFDNPSVYCTDLELIIRHIHQRVRREVDFVVAVPE